LARLEDKELEAAFDYIRLKGWNHFTWHCPNESARSPRLGAKLKRMGLLPGVSDIFIAKPMRNYSGAFIELKSLQKTQQYGKPTPAQLAFIRTMNEHGYYATVANGLDRCIEIIDWYMS